MSNPFSQSGYADLINQSVSDTDIISVTTSLLLPYINPYGILETDINSQVIGAYLTNGQLLIGSTGLAPVPATLTGTAHEIIITLSTPQAIDISSNVTFGTINCSGLNDSALTASLPVHTDASKNLITGLISLTADVTGVLPIANGGTNSSAALVGGFLMDSSGGQIIEGTSSSAPTFSGTATVGQLIDSGLTASLPVHTNGSKQLITAAISLTADVSGVLPIANGGTNSSAALVGGFLMDSSGGKIIEGTSSSAPTFSGTATVGQLIDSGLTASLPVHTNASKQLISGAISLTTDVSGILPIANGGTNSGTALTNGNLIISSAGTLIEGTSATAPSFSGTATVGQLIDSGLTASLPVHTNASKQLITAAISLTADVSGVLPIANGGTNSNAALVGGK